MMSSPFPPALAPCPGTDSEIGTLALNQYQD